MNDPRTCPHGNKEYSGFVICTYPEIHTWTCKDCDTRGHTQSGRHSTDCFCCKPHNDAVLAAWDRSADDRPLGPDSPVYRKGAE